MDLLERRRDGDLVAALRALDATVAAHGSTLDPHLRHYLEKRSYAKAAAWYASTGEPSPSGPR